MEESYRESISLSYKWQFKTLNGEKFFGPRGGEGDWERMVDYPIRFFLWKSNREVWKRLDFWKMSEEVVLSASPIVALEFEQLRSEFSGAEFDDEGEVIDPSEGAASLIPPSLVKLRTLELESESHLLHYVSDDCLAGMTEQVGSTVRWAHVIALQALNCVQSGVNFLNGKDIAMAGAAAIKAREWLLELNFEVGYEVSADDSKRELALKGANAAHAENRRVKGKAIELYEAGSWPSYMQAARVISAQVHRAELVVLRWISEHRRAKAKG